MSQKNQISQISQIMQTCVQSAWIAIGTSYLLKFLFSFFKKQTIAVFPKSKDCAKEFSPFGGARGGFYTICSPNALPIASFPLLT